MKNQRTKFEVVETISGDIHLIIYDQFETLIFNEKDYAEFPGSLAEELSDMAAGKDLVLEYYTTPCDITPDPRPEGVVILDWDESRHPSNMSEVAKRELGRLTLQTLWALTEGTVAYQ